MITVVYIIVGVTIISQLKCYYRSLEDTEKLRRKYMKAKRFYEEKVGIPQMIT